jgi:uncharacterized protein (TIGR02996 family)
VATHSNPELEARILENSDDLSAYLVYSDWLSERGDPRGELIAVQAKLAETPNNPGLKSTEEKLLADNAAVWLGDFAGKGDADLAVKWRLGFLDSVRFGPPLDDYGASELGFPEAIGTLMALPGTTFIRELIIGSKEYDDYPTSWQDCIDALVEHGVPKALRRLEFNRGGFWDISSTELGSLQALYPMVRGLRELTIEMGSLDLGTIDLPALRSLEIVTGGLTSANLESIGSASWPHLEKLSLCIGETDNDYGCNVQLEDIEKLLARDCFGRVRHLGLANASLADEIAGLLPQTKILAQLETLDLSRGTFGDVGARAILDNAAAFRHLKEIDLTHNYVGAELAAELAKIGPRVILAESEEPDDDYRYVQISE